MLADARYRPAMWYHAHTELALIFILSSYRAFLPLPLSSADITTKAVIISIALIGSLTYGLIMRPYVHSERWMGWIRSALLVDALGCTLVTSAIALEDSGLGGPATHEVIVKGSLALTASCIYYVGDSCRWLHVAYVY